MSHEVGGREESGKHVAGIERPSDEWVTCKSQKSCKLSLKLTKLFKSEGHGCQVNKLNAEY